MISSIGVATNNASEARDSVLQMDHLWAAKALNKYFTVTAGNFLCDDKHHKHNDDLKASETILKIGYPFVCNGANWGFLRKSSKISRWQ